MGAVPRRGLLLMVPVVYAVLGFIVMAIACGLCNLVARMVGGIEVELDASSSAG